MNRSLRALALALTTLSTGAQAGEVDLWGLLGNGNSTLSGGDVVYQLRDPAGTTVNVALSFTDMTDGASLQLTAFKFNGVLSSQELRLFSTNLIRIAQGCFNSDPARGASITRWVLSNDAKEEHFYHTAGTRLAKASFGPLQMTLEKRVNGQAHSVSVQMTRRGVPGQAPWVNTCSFSG